MASFIMIATAMLPLVVLAFSALLQRVIYTQKSWILSIPILVSSLFVWHPGFSTGFTTLFPKQGLIAVQIFLMAVWLLILLGSNYSGFAIVRKPKFPKLMRLLFAVLSFAFVLWCFGIPDLKDKEAFSDIILILFGAFLVYQIIFWLIKWGICPLVSLEKETKKAILTDYGVKYVRYAGTKRFLSGEYCYVQFEGDPDEYSISRFIFQSVRNKKGCEYTYEKCECLGGFALIKLLERVSERVPQPSEWELNLQSPKYKRLKKTFAVLAFIAAVICVIVVVLLLIFK